MERYKYPRTFHLPYSEKRGSDNKILIDNTSFKEIYHQSVILETFEEYKHNKTRIAEGFVVRVEECFACTDVSISVAKFVSKEFSIDTPLVRLI